MSQAEAIAALPDDSMEKKILLHILNTPPPDFTELDRQIDEENKAWLDSLDEETRRRVLATPSYQEAAMLLAPISNEKFKYEHLTASTHNLEEIKSFTVTRETGRGLERYLKEIAEQDEHARANRTYIVRDKKTNEIAVYFSLRTGSFTPKRTTQDGEDESKNTVPSVELSNLAVNSAYRERHPEAKRLGERVFRRLIIPAVR